MLFAYLLACMLKSCDLEFQGFEFWGLEFYGFELHGPQVGDKCIKWAIFPSDSLFSGELSPT
jgi:hypothetical protein